MEPSGERQWTDAIEELSAIAIWAVLVCVIAALVALDRAFPEVGMGPLYIPLIAIATWRSGPIGGSLMTIAAIALNVGPMLMGDAPRGSDMTVARAIVRLSSYGFVVLLAATSRHLYDRERANARCDPLTGITNRRTFMTQLDRALRPSPMRATLLLATIDLDGFKAINDGYGHDAGDLVLQRFASRATTMLGNGTVFARLGGDEFAIITEKIGDPDEGGALADDLWRRLSRCLQGALLPDGLSMGALIVPPSAKIAPSEALRRVDDLLAQTKRAGKSRVTYSVLPAEPVDPVQHAAHVALLTNPGCSMTFSASPHGMTVLRRLAFERKPVAPS